MRPFRARGYVTRRAYTYGYKDAKDTISLTIEIDEFETTPEEEYYNLSCLMGEGPIKVTLAAAQSPRNFSEAWREFTLTIMHSLWTDIAVVCQFLTRIINRFREILTEKHTNGEDQ